MFFSSEWNGNAFSLFIIWFYRLSVPGTIFYLPTPFLPFSASKFIDSTLEASGETESIFEQNANRYDANFSGRDNHAAHCSATNFV